MRKLLIIILLAGLSKISLSQLVWNLQNSGTTSNLNCIYVKNLPNFQREIFVCGDFGVILKTSNNGLIWAVSEGY